MIGLQPMTAGQAEIFEHLWYVRRGTEELRDDVRAVNDRLDILVDRMSLVYVRVTRLSLRLDRIYDRLDRIGWRPSASDV